jgi:hypothetical protein
VYGQIVLGEAGEVFFNRSTFPGNSANRMTAFLKVDCFGYSPSDLNDKKMQRYAATFSIGEPSVQTLMGWKLVEENTDPSSHVLMVVESPVMTSKFHFYTPGLNFVAGGVEKWDRNARNAALREVMEETGIVLRPEACEPIGQPITKTIYRNVSSGDAQGKKCQVFLVRALGNSGPRSGMVKRIDPRSAAIESVRRLMSATPFFPHQYGIDVYKSACEALRHRGQGKRRRVDQLAPRNSRTLRVCDFPVVLMLEVQHDRGFCCAKYLPSEYAPTLAELRTKLRLPDDCDLHVTRAWYGYDRKDCHFKETVMVKDTKRRDHTAIRRKLGRQK